MWRVLLPLLPLPAPDNGEGGKQFYRQGKITINELSVQIMRESSAPGNALQRCMALKQGWGCSSVTANPPGKLGECVDDKHLNPATSSLMSFLTRQ